MEKFQNKYRIPSARLLNWDYGANGAYFITICTHKMQCFFGEIVETRFIASATDNEETRFIASATDKEETRFIAFSTDNEETRFIACAIDNEETQFIASVTDNEETRLIASATDNEETRFIACAIDNEETRFIASAIDNEETRFIASAIDNEETRFIASATDNEETRYNALVSDNEETQAADNRAELQYQMQLNELGKIADDNWAKIPNEFPYIELANFQIMPNHMHGILIISKDGFDESVEPPLNACVPNTTETRLIASVLRDNGKNRDDQINRDSCNPDISEIIKNKGGITGNHNPMLQENISRIIRWYKGKCSFEMRKINPDFKWLPRFHDHIIRNSAEFERIQNYIGQNPAKWSADKFYK
jgi:REP element-mobilizing transposase RayT